MKDNIPRTPFSTALSGSARETELRLRNIFSGPKKRPPALFLALMFSVCLLCGNLVSCQMAEAERPPSPEVWVDYPVDFPWDSSSEIELPEYPGVTFRWMPGDVCAITSGSDYISSLQLFTGMPVYNVFLCDLNGDSLRELCATVCWGSGMIDSHVVVYDYAAGTEYTLWDRGNQDYALSMKDGQLQVTRSDYLGPAVAVGSLTLTEDGALEMTDEAPISAEPNQDKPELLQGAIAGVEWEWTVNDTVAWDGEELDTKEKEWEETQLAEYRTVGVTKDGKNYYYQGQLVNIFLDIRPNKSFYTLDLNPAGTVNIKILRNENGAVTGAAYMTEAEAAELLADME